MPRARTSLQVTTRQRDRGAHANPHFAADGGCALRLNSVQQSKGGSYTTELVISDPFPGSNAGRWSFRETRIRLRESDLLSGSLAYRGELVRHLPERIRG